MSGGAMLAALLLTAGCTASPEAAPSPAAKPTTGAAPPSHRCRSARRNGECTSTVTDPHEPTAVTPPGTPHILAATAAAGVVTVAATGELRDARTAETALAPAESTAPGTAIVADLSAVTYLSMEAVAPLLALRHRCAAYGRTLRIVASVPARQKLQLLGLDFASAIGAATTPAPPASAIPPQDTQVAD